MSFDLKILKTLYREEQQISDIDFDSEDNSGICKTTPWTDWSECSEKCGIGFRMKTRGFVDRMGQKKCPHIQTGNLTEPLYGKKYEKFNILNFF